MNTSILDSLFSSHAARVPPSGGMGLPPLTESPSRPFLDRDLTVYREGTRWSFEANKILINGFSADLILNQETPDISYWMGLADGLTDYRKKISRMAREKEQIMKCESVIEGLLCKILGRLKKVYDQKISGISWKMEDGQLVLNGINIRSFLALYRLRKTDKAARFLKGLRRKLALLLENRQESPDNERIHDVLEELYQEVEAELYGDTKAQAARSSRRLLVASASPF